jgi:hypothetical protein
VKATLRVLKTFEVTRKVGALVSRKVGQGSEPVVYDGPRQTTYHYQAGEALTFSSRRLLRAFVQGLGELAVNVEELV